jgi:hypothetical protein
VRAARAGAQFVIATHSPILLACPEARIYELDGGGIAACDYDELETVRLTRGFLDAPDRFIRAALEDERVSDLIAIWVAGAAVLLLIALAAGLFLRFTRVGRELGITLGELVKVLAVCVVLSCAVYSLVTLVV